MRQVVLIDGKNQLYRNHFSPSLMHLSREDGFPTGSIFGNLNYVLLGVHKHLPDASFVWCWDGQGETWRHKLMSDNPPLEVKPTDEMTDFQASMITNTLEYFGMGKPKKKKKRIVYGYKANREWSPTKHKTKYPTDEKERALIQIPVIKLILSGIGIRQFEIQGLECDDLIGILTHKIMDMDSEAEIYIFSSDRDFYQLLQYEQVNIIKSTKDGKLEKVKVFEIEEKFGVKLEDWTKFRAWTGDTTDNIPHLFKVGPKTALKMLGAGLDPSIPEVNELDLYTKSSFTKYFEPHGIEKLWPQVHNNYKLCELVTDIDNKLLSDEVRDKLHKAFRDVKSVSDLGRNKANKGPEAYRKLTYLLAQYELASILAERDKLWNLP